MRGNLTACFVLWLSAIAQAAAPALVRAAYYRVNTPADPGSAYVLVRNTGAEPLHVDQLLMDGSPLPAFGIGEGLKPMAEKKQDPVALLSAARIIWARLEPNPIPPGRTALLYVQYRNRPPYAFHLQLSRQKAAVAECKLFPVDEPIRIANIAFSHDLMKCGIYVENTGKEATERVKAVEFNDTDVTDRAWFSSRELPPGAKGLIVVPRPGVVAGQKAQVVVTLESGRAVGETLRALPFFPIALENGGSAPEFGITDAVHNLPLPDRTTLLPQPAVSCLRLFTCPAHKMGGDWQGVAAEILRLRAAAAQNHPACPTFVAVCRARAVLASASFAHTSDFGHLNPYLPQYSPTQPPRPLDAVFHAMQMLRASNAPDPVLALLSDTSFGNEKEQASPDELRRLLYASLACGARGMLYRMNVARLGDAQAQGLKEFNGKVKSLAPLLLLGEPVAWASSSNEQVKPRVLVAGTDGLLLFLLNDGDKEGRMIPAGPAEVTVRVPTWLPALSLSPESDPLDGSVTVEARRTQATVKTLGSALLLVFRSAQPGPSPQGRGKP